MRSIQLIRLLKKNERTQAWLSRQLNLTPTTINKWCNEEKKIPPEREKQIRRILK